MKKFITAIALTAVMAAPAFAHGAHRGARARRVAFERVASRLNLTTAQREQMREIRLAERERNKQLLTEFRAKRQELRQLHQANDPRAESFRAEMRAMGDQVRAARKASRARVLSVLSAGQRQELEQMRENRRAFRR